MSDRAAKQVLDVGQCAMDHGALRRLIEKAFGARVVQAHDAQQALAHLKAEPFDLVLVNRMLDADGSAGLDIIRHVKADPALADTPMMLVSNYADAQEQAVEAGALLGFGKAQLGTPQTRQRLGQVLE